MFLGQSFRERLYAVYEIAENPELLVSNTNYLTEKPYNKEDINSSIIWSKYGISLIIGYLSASFFEILVIRKLLVIITICFVVIAGDTVVRWFL
jgi:hypothetical protein